MNVTAPTNTARLISNYFCLGAYPSVGSGGWFRSGCWGVRMRPVIRPYSTSMSMEHIYGNTGRVFRADLPGISQKEESAAGPHSDRLGGECVA
jgi:hypothetical protein